MAAILITGNIDFFTKDLLESLSKEHQIILVGNIESIVEEEKANVCYVNERGGVFSQLFDLYHIQAVWYIGEFTDRGIDSFDREQWMEKVISECRRYHVEKVIFLSTSESRNYLVKYGKNGDPICKEFPSVRALRAAQEEDLCKYYAQKYNVAMEVFWLPYTSYRTGDIKCIMKKFEDIMT